MSPNILMMRFQPLATLLTLADAPKAYYISVKLGVEGIGEILKRSISAALTRYPNCKRLNVLLEKITEKFDPIISSFTHLDKEFTHMIQITTSYQFLGGIESGILGHSVDMKAKPSWAILHSILHLDRIAYRHNGYTWLGDLLIAASIWSTVRNLQRQIALAGVHVSSISSRPPLSISLICGLLKSRHHIIRWGFLFVLERLLMRYKFLLDENEQQYSGGSEVGQIHEDNRLEKANVVIDIMSSALSLVAQKETNHINILKMCDIFFSQLCLKVLPATTTPISDNKHYGLIFGSSGENKNVDTSECISQEVNCHWDEFMDEFDSRFGYNSSTPRICETASIAALLS